MGLASRGLAQVLCEKEKKYRAKKIVPFGCTVLEYRRPKFLPKSLYQLLHFRCAPGKPDTSKQVLSGVWREVVYSSLPIFGITLRVGERLKGLLFYLCQISDREFGGWVQNPFGLKSGNRRANYRVRIVSRDLCQAQFSARVRTAKRAELFSPAALAIDQLLLKLHELALNPIGGR